MTEIYGANLLGNEKRWEWIAYLLLVILGLMSFGFQIPFLEMSLTAPKYVGYIVGVLSFYMVYLVWGDVI